ncbi:serine protease 30-like isoform X2 [Macrobrachium rosenbergii]|uniref:serine protease 30-like isoform X2 n=1 Tax=Macrobrachium rosenbergii TaxID=79674 RepID=UPI0034D5D5E6
MRLLVVCACVIALSAAGIKARQCIGRKCRETSLFDDIPGNCFTPLLPWLCRIGHVCCRFRDPNGNIIKGYPKRKCAATSAQCETRGGTCLNARDTCLTADVPRLCAGDSCSCCVGDHKRCSSTPKCRFQGGYCFRGQRKVFCPSQQVMREGCSGRRCACCFTDRKCSCGKALQSTRIIGGQPVKPKNKYPWMVGLQVPSLANDTYVCGGAIISNLYILTAAHCLFNDDDTSRLPEDILVGVADHRQNSTKDDVEGATGLVGVRDIHIHEEYGTGPNNDIGLLKLKKPLDLKSFKQLKPVCLPSNPRKTYEGAEGHIYGWGIKGFHSRLPAVLQETSVNVLGPECQNKFQDVNITPQMLCAGDKKGDKDTCSGDSGGPMTVEENGRHVLVGITSFGIGCGIRGSPGVYTRVTAFLDWVLENTKDAEYCN